MQNYHQTPVDTSFYALYVTLNLLLFSAIGRLNANEGTVASIDKIDNRSAPACHLNDYGQKPAVVNSAVQNVKQHVPIGCRPIGAKIDRHLNDT